MIVTRINYDENGVAVIKEIREMTATEYIQISQFEVKMKSVLTADEIRMSMMAPSTN